MGKKSVIPQLKERRVIRATLIYVALLWVVLQVANVLEEASFISAQAVQALILVGVVGLVATIVGSWFLESPWKQRKWISVAGDVVIIVAVTVAAAMFAWQQWFTSFTRPTVAILKIEATDTKAESEDLATHLALRLRTALATRAEIRVIELASSQHASVIGKSVPDVATALNAEFLIKGTFAQSGSQVRWNVQLFSADGGLIFGETYEDRLLDQAQLQNRVMADLWAELPLPDDGLGTVRSIIADCEYPDDRGALLAIAAIDAGKSTDLTPFAEPLAKSGMLQLASSRSLLADLEQAESTRKPVLQPIAMQSLATVAELCPGLPDPALMRIENTRETVTDGQLHTFPNSAVLFYRAGEQDSEPDRANALMAEAQLLDPLRDW